jgi:C-terminal processing protease CtpA/Prc
MDYLYYFPVRCLRIYQLPCCFPLRSTAETTISSSASIRNVAQLEEAVSSQLDLLEGARGSNSVMVAYESEKGSALDEVWSLIYKYYIDRTFKMHDKYRLAFDQSNGEEQQTNQITEMVKSLGDKYSRMLSREMYTAIQRYDLIGVGVTLAPNSAK